jgi:hypothetical protein
VSPPRFFFAILISVSIPLLPDLRQACSLNGASPKRGQFLAYDHPKVGRINLRATRHLSEPVLSITISHYVWPSAVLSFPSLFNIIPFAIYLFLYRSSILTIRALANSRINHRLPSDCQRNYYNVSFAIPNVPPLGPPTPPRAHSPRLKPFCSGIVYNCFHYFYN